MQNKRWRELRNSNYIKYSFNKRKSELYNPLLWVRGETPECSPKYSHTPQWCHSPSYYSFIPLHQCTHALTHNKLHLVSTHGYYPLHRIVSPNMEIMSPWRGSCCTSDSSIWIGFCWANWTTRAWLSISCAVLNCKRVGVLNWAWARINLPSLRNDLALKVNLWKHLH